tara:strand:- start:295 stop:1665 length:1371 start_codon:yes stop_codon:yes gene_type:complete
MTMQLPRGVWSGLSLLSLLLILLGGCETLEQQSATETYEDFRNQTEKAPFNVTFNYDDAVVVDDSYVATQYYEGTVKVGRAEVAFQAGMKEQAGEMAMEMEEYIAHIERHFGRTLETPVRAYLLRRDYMPGSVTGGFAPTNSAFQFPLFAIEGNEDFETIRSSNPFYPYMFIHELTKLSLVDPARPPLILADQKTGPMMKTHYFTRWFREGLANYAELLVYEKMRERVVEGENYTALSSFESNHVFQQPLSALAKVGPALFSWEDFGENAQNRDYYNAAMGLFILLEHRYGEDAIRKVMDQLETQYYVDGQVILNTINATLGTNIEQEVQGFDLMTAGAQASPLSPATAKNFGLAVQKGLYVNALTETGAAQSAGVQRGDVIIGINRRTVTNNLDYEMAMLEAQDHGNLYFTVDRLGERHTLGVKVNVPTVAPMGGIGGGGSGVISGDVLGFTGGE